MTRFHRGTGIIWTAAVLAAMISAHHAKFDLEPLSIVSAALAEEPKPPLSQAELKMLSTWMVKDGVDTKLEARPATVFGLIALGEPLTVRELVLGPTAEDPIKHAFAALGGGGYLLIAQSQTKGSTRSYRANANQELVAAMEWNSASEPVAIPVADAQKELAVEFKFWDNVTDPYVRPKSPTAVSPQQSAPQSPPRVAAPPPAEK